MLTMADEGRTGVGEMLTMADEGGRGVWAPILADIICEQPLMQDRQKTDRHKSLCLTLV